MDPVQLREATAAEHSSVEQHMPLMEPDLTRERYADTLAHIYPLLAGWESYAARNAPADLQALIAARSRSPLLAADLAALGRAVPQADGFDPAAIPGLPAPAALLGAMYVMEGSTLGGQFIARHVEPLLGLDPGSGTAYFRGYGDQTGSMWRGFQEVLRGRPSSEDPAITLASRAMFAHFEAAIRPLSRHL